MEPLIHFKEADILNGENVVIYGLDMDIMPGDFVYIVGKVNRSGNGARPMKHIITNEIKNKIGKQIVFGNVKDGGKINLSIKDDKIIFGGINED